MEDFKWLYALKSGILFINCYHAIINYYAIITKYVLPKNTSARLIHERELTFYSFSVTVSLFMLSFSLMQLSNEACVFRQRSYF